MKCVKVTLQLFDGIKGGQSQKRRLQEVTCNGEWLIGLPEISEEEMSNFSLFLKPNDISELRIFTLCHFSAMPL